MFIKPPELFHGQSMQRPFFEGWYHKMSTKNNQTVVVIPGIFCLLYTSDAADDP